MIGGFMMSVNNNAQAQNSTTFKPHGKIFAKFFGDYYYKLGGEQNTFSRAQYAGDKVDMNGFDIRRVYFGYTYQFTPDISTKIELAQEGGGNVLTDGKRAFYLKNADISIANVIPNGTIVVGHTGTPTFATFTEHIWGYRSVEKTLLDMRHIGGSNDLGVAVKGNFDSDGVFGYYFMVGNGTGASVENNKYKKLYGEVHAKLLNKKLLLEAYADYEGAPQDQGKTTIKGFVGYQNTDLTVGLSAFKQWRKNALQLGLNRVDETPTGLSIFAHGTLVEGKLNGFIRQDLFNPDSKKNFTGYKENFTLLGLDYKASKLVHFMPNIWINSYSAMGNNPSKKSDVVARVTWYFSF
jgi:hypothetical protein